MPTGLGFADDLERLFGRPIDLVTEQSIRNPYFKSEVESTRQLVI
jgi:predicted nucleotidyltransferase